MKRILAFATLFAACAASMAQTEVLSIDRHDYLQIDTIDAGRDGQDKRFLALTGRDSTLSLFDTYRHWMSPKIWHLRKDAWAWPIHLCDNTTTSLFIIYNAQQGENWLVTLSGDKVVLPNYMSIETEGNLLALSYGADRFFATRDGYASLKTKARRLKSRIDAITPWERNDTVGRVTYRIDWPTDSSVLSQNVRQWISAEMSECNTYAWVAADSASGNPASDQDQGMLPLILDARMSTDSLQLFNGYAAMWIDGLKADKVPAGKGCFMALTVLCRAAAEHFVTYLAESSQYTGGAHGMETFRYATFSRSTGKKLEWTDIIAEGCRGKVNRMIAEELDRQGKKNAYDIENLSETNVALLPGGVVFCYQPYEIGGYAEGIFFVLLPYSRIAGCLKVAP